MWLIHRMSAKNIVPLQQKLSFTDYDQLIGDAIYLLVVGKFIMAGHTDFFARRRHFEMVTEQIGRAHV